METKDIIQIIKACHAHGVNEFVFDKLRLSFCPEKVPQQTTPLIPNHAPVKIPVQVERQMEEVAQEAASLDRKHGLEDEIDTLVITDPFQYEENLANGELVDEAQLQH